MSAKTTNPFRGLTEAQHCRDWYGFRDGKRVGANPQALQSAETVCATGAMWRAGYTSGDTYQFSQWLNGKHGETVETLNDVRGWTFAQFADAWDEWQKGQVAG